MIQAKILSVSELTGAIKHLLESQFQEIALRGEISNLRQQASGHIYFSLKDAGATISCVCFRGDAARLGLKLRDGMQVIGQGRLSLYEPHGKYQIILRKIEEDGVGRLEAAFQALKQKLQAEGLFDQSRKQSLPHLAKSIAIVTSPTGAALRDFISILKRRNWAGRLVVIPARVQGSEAAAEIAEGIKLANEHQLGELIVVGRGGGSLEDLWPFNEEQVVRAISASKLPIISAVGHEIDFTLSDFAADHRAETPSAAAEWITSNWHAYLAASQNLNQRLKKVTSLHLRHLRQLVQLHGAKLQSHHPRNRLEQAALRLDDLQGRLHATLGQTLQDRRHRLNNANTRFHALRPETQLKHFRESLRQLSLRLANNSHQASLRRGYAILRDANGNLASASDAIPPNSNFVVEMKDGRFDARRLPTEN